MCLQLHSTLNQYIDINSPILFNKCILNLDKSIIYNDRLVSIPRILETPYIDKEFAPYKYEIEMIRNKKFDKDATK